MSDWGLQRVGEVIEGLLRRRDWETKFQQQRLGRFWPEIAGPYLAKVSQPLQVRQGVLSVWVSSSAWAQEFSLHKPQLLAQIRRYLPEAEIQDLRFVTTYGEPPAEEEPETDESVPYPSGEDLEEVTLTASERQAIEKAAQQLRDPELQAAFRQSMERDLKSRRWRVKHGWRPCPQCQNLYYGPEELCPICRLALEAGPSGPSDGAEASESKG